MQLFVDMQLFAVGGRVADIHQTILYFGMPEPHLAPWFAQVHAETGRRFYANN
jgi:hypothetical protein